MKFSIVTPSWNSEAYLAETIDSVISQKGDFDIEYIVQDNQSGDRTCEIVRNYMAMLESGSYPIRCKSVSMRLISEPDTGMYDAINRGFSGATGDVYAYINSDDIYLPGAFQVVARCMALRPDVAWLKGITSYINAGSAIIAIGKCNLYCQEWLRLGIYGRAAGFVQQDSVFWRAALWQTSGGCDSGLKVAGDYRLWMTFAQHARLYSVVAYLSCFRRVQGQLSENMEPYWREVNALSDGLCGLDSSIRGFRTREAILPRFLKLVFFRALFGTPQFDLLTVDVVGGVAAHRGDYYSVQSLISPGVRG